MNAAVRTAAALAAVPPGVVPPAACSVCGTLVAASTVLHDQALGQACSMCRQTAEAIRIRLTVAQGRQTADLESQLRRMVLDIRAGADMPTFDQPDFA